MDVFCRVRPHREIGNLIPLIKPLTNIIALPIPNNYVVRYRVHYSIYLYDDVGSIGSLYLSQSNIRICSMEACDCK
jgi:hypothetical protein